MSPARIQTLIALLRLRPVHQRLLHLNASIRLLLPLYPHLQRAYSPTRAVQLYASYPPKTYSRNPVVMEPRVSSHPPTFINIDSSETTTMTAMPTYCNVRLYWSQHIYSTHQTTVKSQSAECAVSFSLAPNAQCRMRSLLFQAPNAQSPFLSAECAAPNAQSPFPSAECAISFPKAPNAQRRMRSLLSLAPNAQSPFP